MTCRNGVSKRDIFLRHIVRVTTSNNCRENLGLFWARGMPLDVN